jgi:hypothetical protein
VERFWVPGAHLDDEYPTPTSEELTAAWVAMTHRETHPMEGVFGVWSVPEQPVTALASVDLCEVIRQTSVALDHVTGMPPRIRSRYPVDSWFHRDVSDLNYEESVVITGVRVAMNHGLVPPMHDLDETRELLQLWRSKGVYITANTSTLPGCELATIRDFSERNGLSDCFDALLLPRNHDGSGTVTKAVALQQLAATLDIDLTKTPFVHIDDSLHHIAAFSRQFEQYDTMGLFIPSHTDNADPLTDSHCESPALSFARATSILRAQGVAV